MKNKIFCALVVLSFTLPTISTTIGQADESTVNKVKDDVGDATTNTKKLARKGNRKLRKATGNDNILKDAKDKANDAGDDISNGVDKAKRKTDSN